MKITANFAIAFLIFSFISCNDSDDSVVESVSEELVIISETLTTTYNSNSNNTQLIYNTTIEDNKRRNSTLTENSETVQNRNYIYNTADLLIGRDFVNSDNDDYEYNYDANNELSEIVYHLNNTTAKYYRIVKQTDNVYFQEWINLPFNDPDTEINRRLIVEFDNNDNIIKAGVDNDKDGNYDSFRTFVYSENQNLTEIIDEEGQSFTFEYSTIKNTEYYITAQTFGKRNLNLHNSEAFALININNITLKYASAYVANAEINDNNYIFELFENGYFKKRTSVIPLNNGTETKELVYTLQ